MPAQALRAALAAGVRAPCILFLNIEPDTSGFLPLELRDLYAARHRADDRVRRGHRASATQRPGALLGHVADMRAMGVAVALDDVGTDADTLAMMALLAPEVIKLDLALVQGSPDAEIAEVVHAVAAQAERSGATMLVEGVETREQAGPATRSARASRRAGSTAGAAHRAARAPRAASRVPGRHADPRDLAPFALVCEPRAPGPRRRRCCWR